MRKKFELVLVIICFASILVAIGYNWGKHSNSAKIENELTYQFTKYYTIVRFNGAVDELWLDQDVFICKVNQVDDNGHNCRLTSEHPQFNYFVDSLGL